MRQLILAAGLIACATAAAAGELAKDADTVVVSQGGVDVTLKDVDAYVHRIPAIDRHGFISKPERIETMLRTMLLDKQLAKQAREQRLDKDELVQRQIELAADTALSRARVEQFREGLKAPDFSELAYEDYLANKTKYLVPARFDVKHILFATKTRTPAEAEALANETAAKLKQDPSTFDALVESLSEDESKKENHGLIANATSEQFVRQFSEAAGKLTKVGEISPVVKTSFGYHILKLIEQTPAKQLSYNEVSETIKSRMLAEWTEAQIRGLLDGLRNQSMDPKPEVLATLRDRFKPVGPATAATGTTADPASAPAHTD